MIPIARDMMILFNLLKDGASVERWAGSLGDTNMAIYTLLSDTKGFLFGSYPGAPPAPYAQTK